MQEIWMIDWYIRHQMTSKFWTNSVINFKVFDCWSLWGEWAQLSKKYVLTLPPDWPEIDSTCAEVIYSSSFPWIIDCRTFIRGKDNSMSHLVNLSSSQKSANPLNFRSMLLWCFLRLSSRFTELKFSRSFCMERLLGLHKRHVMLRLQFLAIY